MKNNFIIIFFICFQILLTPSLFSQQETKKGEEQKPAYRPVNQIHLTSDYLPIDSFHYNSHELFTRLKLFNAYGLNFFGLVKAQKIETDDQTGGYFPKNLYNMTFSLRAQNEKLFVDAILVSKSDKPFYSKDEIRPGVFAFYNIYPTGPMGSGLYAGFIYFPFDSILPWNIPFPFVNYQYFSKDLTLMAGIPLLVRWNVLPYLGISLFYLPVANIKASLDFYLNRMLKISLEGSWWTENYTLANRENKEEKLYFETQKMGVRFSQRFFYLFEVSLFGGRSIAVDYFKGEGFTDRWEKKELKNTWILEASLKANF